MKVDLDKKTVTCEFTFDELHAFSEHVTWCIYEQDQPVDDNLQSFIDKVLYDNMSGFPNTSDKP